MSHRPWVRAEFRQRLGDDWRDLADHLGVPTHVCRTFPVGDEPRAIWEWVARRKGLDQLPTALDAIGRQDLSLLLAPQRSGADAVRPAVEVPTMEITTGSSPSYESRRRYVLLTAVVAVLAVGAAAALVVTDVWDVPPDESAGVPPPRGPSAPVATIVVQNMIAAGPESLIEDGTPAYLSTVPQPYCVENACKVDGTDMWTGTALTATCYVRGAWMTNCDTGDSDARRNPNRIDSHLWYQVKMPDGKEGLISEVYVAPQYPICQAHVGHGTG